MAELKPFRGNYYLWKYLPSSIAAAIFMILFLIATFAHGWRLYRMRKWFCIPFVVGGFMEFVGYAVRIAAREKTQKLMPFAIQSSYILLAPVLFAATIYMTLGRVIRAIPGGSTFSPMNPRWITRTFVTADVLTMCIQSGASGLMFSQNTRKIGNGLVIGGLILQCVMFGVFLSITVLFHMRLRRASSHAIKLERSWKQYLLLLHAVSSLILLRSVFRVIEYIGGQDGYLLSREWPLYVFDTVPMLTVMVISYLRYPGLLNDFVAVTSETSDVETLSEINLGKS